MKSIVRGVRTADTVARQRNFLTIRGKGNIVSAQRRSLVSWALILAFGLALVIPRAQAGSSLCTTAEFVPAGTLSKLLEYGYWNGYLLETVPAQTFTTTCGGRLHSISVYLEKNGTIYRPPPDLYFYVVPANGSVFDFGAPALVSPENLASATDLSPVMVTADFSPQPRASRNAHHAEGLACDRVENFRVSARIADWDTRL